MHIRIAALAVALVASSGQAAERFTYKFTAGKPLKYRTVLLSEGSFSLPDGSPKTMKLEAVSLVQLTPQASTPEGWKLATETLRTKTLMEGRQVPAPPARDSRRVIVVHPDGSIHGGEEQTFAVIFPGRPLARGESFTAERKPAAGGPGLPLLTTYTVADTRASVPGYPAPVALIEAKDELAGPLPGRKLTLRAGGGKLWFDAAAGVLVKVQLGYAFSEEKSFPGGSGSSTNTTTIRYTSELVR